jgi:hypothetical protein
MTTPATGEKSPKRKRIDAELALISPQRPQKAQEDAIRAMVAAFASTSASANNDAPASSGTTASSSQQEEDIEFDYEPPDEVEPTVEKPPAVLKCSLTSLPTAFTTFAEHISKKVISLLLQKRAKTSIATKLRSKSFIPSSLKTEFELTSSKEVRGCTEFFHLAAAASTAMTTCIEEIKGYMADVADMESKIIDQKIHELLFVALDGFTRLLLISSLQRTDQLPAREFTLTTLSKYSHYFSIPANYGIDNEDALYAMYKEKMSDPNPLWTPQAVTTEFVETHCTDMATLASLIDDTFIVRWTRRLAEMKAKETSFLLDTAQKKILHDTACADTAKALAQEKTLDDTQMNVIIADKLTETTKELASKLGRLENIVSRAQPPGKTTNDSSRKKSQGGAKQTRASGNKKTNAPKVTFKKGTNQNRNATVDDSANDSSSAKNAKNKRNKKKPTTGANKNKTAPSKSTQRRS